MSRNAAASAPVAISPDAVLLQGYLHQLLSGLTDTIDHVKNWPEAANDPSQHVRSTTALLTKIRGLLSNIEKVEMTVKEKQKLRETLNNCQIPLDLLDLFDHSIPLHPDCFSRGLLREALGQLAGLKRRKLALSLLGAAVQSGIGDEKPTATKRERENDSEEPPMKKGKTN